MNDELGHIPAPGLRQAIAGLVLASILGAGGCGPGSGREVRMFKETGKIGASDAQDYGHFGQSVALDGDCLVAGSPLGSAPDRGFAHISRRTGGEPAAWTEIARIRGDDTVNLDFFGSAVAIGGDHVVVGAPAADAPGVWDCGAAYVFVRDEGGANNWGQQKKLSAPEAADSDDFGRAVAVDGDYIVVGAPSKRGEYNGEGAAFVFYRHQYGEDQWGLVQRIAPSDPHFNMEFGRDVAISGDLVLVGARGRAYLFRRNSPSPGLWGEISRLVGSGTVEADDFGNAVDVCEDWAVVGAHSWPGGGEYRGAAYIFGRDRGGADHWGEVCRLTAGDARAMDEFGWDVAVDEDCVIVGAMYAADLFNSQGAAYFFARDQGGENAWGELNKVMAGDTEEGDLLGSSVGISGDNAVAGAPGEDGLGTDRGAVYVFQKVIR